MVILMVHIIKRASLAQLFDVSCSVAAKHLKNIFEGGELSEEAVCAKFAQTADNGKIYQFAFA